MRRLLSILVIFVLTSVSFGSGWNDYEQQLGNGYSIVRANARDIALTHHGSVVTGNDPLIEFVDTPTHFFTKHRREDGSFSYYVVQKQPEHVIGPLAERDFLANDVVVAAGGLKWQPPTNPHPEVARNGRLVFLAFTLILFGAPVLLLMLLVSQLVRNSRRTREDRTATG
jgi:hypothetical protein